MIAAALGGIGMLEGAQPALPHRVTQWGTAAATTVAELPGCTSLVPFMGSAIAIGKQAREHRRPRDA